MEQEILSGIKISKSKAQSERSYKYKITLHMLYRPDSVDI